MSPAARGHVEPRIWCKKPAARGRKCFQYMIHTKTNIDEVFNQDGFSTHVDVEYKTCKPKNIDKKKVTLIGDVGELCDCCFVVGFEGRAVSLAEDQAHLPDSSWSVTAYRDGGDHRQMVAADAPTHRPRAAAGEVLATEDGVRGAQVAPVTGTGVGSVVQGDKLAAGHPVGQEPPRLVLLRAVSVPLRVVGVPVSD